VKDHIQKGDIYEMNFCMEFFAENCFIDPFESYLRLNDISPAPFSAFYRLPEHYLLCSSPERFIQKNGDTIISQPIKGTARRGTSPEKDEEIKTELFNNLKERSENVMIVDLVRNDLSHTAVKDSVKIDELFGIYSFAQVHQMVSTITSKIKSGIHFSDVIRHAFPMGSMTGAPKIRAMQIIEEYEITKRGLYSGSVGYISPEGDFDFNVVIRSIQYNQSLQSLSFMTGSAITSLANAGDEYQECLLKAKAMMRIFEE
ncbi:MAG: anthranilate synthase component I family protein, partial [Bacteroidales bacterium]|nr:anthranilate synthase component I family protein [Bacteroidales bacterium]